MSNINKSGSLFKRNINTSEEFGIVKKLNVPNSVTYTESEIAEEKRRMAKRATPNCTTCPECPPYEEDDDDGGSEEVPPNTGLPGELPNNMFQSVIGYAENGYPLTYIFPENGKSAWDTLYEYLFSLNDGRTDIIFFGEKSLVHEDNPSSGDMVGGFADGFSKALLELTGRELYATPIYYGLETVTAPTYNSLDNTTWNDGNPNGYGRVMVGTRNVYTSFGNADGTTPFYSTVSDTYDLLTRSQNGFDQYYFANSDPSFYSYYDTTNTFKIRDGGERDPYYKIIWNESTKQYQYDSTQLFGSTPFITFLFYNGKRTFGANGGPFSSSNMQTAAALMAPVQLIKNNGIYEVGADSERAQSYFTVDSLFNRQTMTLLTTSSEWGTRIAEITVDGQDIVIDRFFYHPMIYGYVPPYLGKWYSVNRQSETWNSGDNFEVDSTKQKIRIQKNENNDYTIIYDPNDEITIDLRNTNLSYLNSYYPRHPSIIENDVIKFGNDNGLLSISITPPYLAKLRDPSFSWNDVSFSGMPGNEDTSFMSILDLEAFDVVGPSSTVGEDGYYLPNYSELNNRYNNTIISNLNTEAENPFSQGMPDIYYGDEGWYFLSIPATYNRRVGNAVVNLTEQELEKYYLEEKFSIGIEGSIGIKPYQKGLPTSSLFRTFKAGVFMSGPDQLLNSPSVSGNPHGSTYNQQEFCKRSFFYSSYYSDGSPTPRSKQHDKNRRVKCYMKTGLYMNNQDQYYTKTSKEPIYSSNNFKYLVGYFKPPILQTPEGTMNETLKNSTICLSITPETDAGTLGTSFTNVHTQTADNIQTKPGFVSLTADLSSLSSTYTKLNLSFLGYNTENKTEGEIIITTHSGIDANNQNGLSFSVFSVDPALRLADIEYAYRNSGYASHFLQLFRHIKERQTNLTYGGNNQRCKIVIVWLVGRQEAGNDSNNINLYGGAQGQDYMSDTFPVLMSLLVAHGFAPSDIINLFVCHPKAASFSNTVDEAGRSIKDPLQYTNLAEQDCKRTFNGTKSIFFATNENQNPTLGILKVKRTNKTPVEKETFIDQYRFFNTDTQQYEQSPTSRFLAGTKPGSNGATWESYSRNILYFDTPAMANVNINNRLNDSHYSVEYDINNNPVVSYKYLNERGYLQVGKDMINIMKNGL